MKRCSAMQRSQAARWRFPRRDGEMLWTFQLGIRSQVRGPAVIRAAPVSRGAAGLQPVEDWQKF